MIVDRSGYRLNVGIILANASGRIFWGKRSGHDAWQFPQGGVAKGESIEHAMFRELHEEIGLDPRDVTIPLSQAIGCVTVSLSNISVTALGLWSSGKSKNGSY